MLFLIKKKKIENKCLILTVYSANPNTTCNKKYRILLNIQNKTFSYSYRALKKSWELSSPLLLN